MQALSEIYGRAIEIYSYSKEPMRTFHEHCDSSVAPLRLSYHGKSHYNALVPSGWSKDQSFLKEVPGVFEESVIDNYAKNETEPTNKDEPVSEEIRLVNSLPRGALLNKYRLLI